MSLTTKKFNLLQNFRKKGNLTFDSYPIIVIKDALPNDLYQKLVQEYPSFPLCFQNDLKNHQVIRANTRYEINTDHILDDPDIYCNWKDFVQYHTSKLFLNQILDLLQSEIRKIHPNLENELGATFHDWTQGIQWRSRDKTVEMDSLVGYHSPVLQKSTPQGKHLEDPTEFYSGIYFLRSDLDDVKGGSLEFYADPSGKEVKTEFHPLWGPNTVRNGNLKKILTVPYQKNCFVLWINTQDSVHAFSDLDQTLHCRRMVRISGRIPNHPQGGFYNQI